MIYQLCSLPNVVATETTNKIKDILEEYYEFHTASAFSEDDIISQQLDEMLKLTTDTELDNLSVYFRRLYKNVASPDFIKLSLPEELILLKQLDHYINTKMDEKDSDYEILDALLTNISTQELSDSDKEWFETNYDTKEECLEMVQYWSDVRNYKEFLFEDWDCLQLESLSQDEYLQFAENHPELGLDDAFGNAKTYIN